MRSANRETGLWMRLSAAAARRALGGGALVELPGHLFYLVELHHIARLHVVEAFHADTALEPGVHLTHVFLEVLERRDLAVVDLHAVAQHTNPRVARRLALGDLGARDGSDLGDAEDLSHLGAADDLLARLGRQEALHRLANIVEQLVDDVV